jgi:hypothetical protein
MLIFVIEVVRMAYRAELRHEKADPRPLVPGRRESWPTLTLSMNTDPVSETRSAILFLMGGAVRPLAP